MYTFYYIYIIRHSHWHLDRADHCHKMKFERKEMMVFMLLRALMLPRIPTCNLYTVLYIFLFLVLLLICFLTTTSNSSSNRFSLLFFRKAFYLLILQKISMSDLNIIYFDCHFCVTATVTFSLFQRVLFEISILVKTSRIRAG